MRLFCWKPFTTVFGRHELSVTKVRVRCDLKQKCETSGEQGQEGCDVGQDGRGRIAQVVSAGVALDVLQLGAGQFHDTGDQFAACLAGVCGAVAAHEAVAINVYNKINI